MDLKIISSGSVGNAYILEAEHQALLIECGVPFFDIKKGIDFNIHKFVGCVLTHEHGDHAKSILSILNSGIKVFSSKGTHKAKATLKHSNAVIVESFKKYKVGEFTIMSFPVEHDCNEPIGFLIHHPECGLVLFATDTNWINYRFENMNQIIIEANFSEQTFKEKVINNTANKWINTRVLDTHFSLENCIKWIESNDLTNVNNIVLIHMSDNNSVNGKFHNDLYQATVKNIHLAEKDKVINFNIKPF